MQRATDAPNTLYVNLTSCATSSSTLLPFDPVASYSESRNTSVVDDIGRYSMAVVRATLQGQRNFPLLIASIVPNQTDPYLTVYNIRLKLTVNRSIAYSPPDYQTISRRLVVRVFDATDQQIEVRMITLYDPVGTPTAAAVASATQALLSISEPTKPFIKALQVGVQVVAGNDTLVFTPGVGSWPAGLYFSVEPNGAAGVANFWGFPDASSVQYSTGVNPLVLPFPCSYVSGPQVPVTLDSGYIPLRWESQVVGTADPRQPIPVQDDTDYSYWLYDYSWFAYLLNNTFATAYDIISTEASLAGIELQTEAPFVFYEPSTKNFVLNVTPTSISSAPEWEGQESLSVMLSEEIANLLAYPGMYDTQGNETLIWYGARLNASNTYLQLRSDYPSGATANGWSPVGSIVFMAGGGWGMRQEIMSAPRLFGTSSDTSQSSTSSNDTAQVLTDVVPASGDASDLNGFMIVYSPQVIREIESTARGLPLRDLDFSVFWRNAKTGRMLPVTLNPSASMSVKIMLRRVR